MIFPLFLKAKLDEEIQKWLLKYNILHPVYNNAISKLEVFIEDNSYKCEQLFNLIDNYQKKIINHIKGIYNQKEDYFGIIPSIEEKEFWRSEDNIEKLLQTIVSQQKNLSNQVKQLCTRLRELYQILAEYRICQILSKSSIKFIIPDKNSYSSEKNVDFLIELDKCSIALEVKAPVCFQEEDVCLNKSIEKLLKKLQALALGFSHMGYQCYYDDRKPYFQEKHYDYSNSNEMIFEVLLKKISRNLRKRQWENTKTDCSLAVIFLDVFHFQNPFNKEVLREFKAYNMTESVNGILYYLVFGKKGDTIREFTLEGARDFQLSQDGLKHSHPDLDGLIFHYSKTSSEYLKDIFKEFFVFYLLNSKCKKCIEGFQNSLSIPIALSNKDNHEFFSSEFVSSVINIID